MNHKKIVFVLLALFTFNFTVFCQSDQSTNLELEINSGKAILKGTLITPHPDKKLPLIIVVPGSGQIKRQELRGIVSALFQDLELAVFIYDKRGVGESSGTYIAPNTLNSKKTIKARGKDVVNMVKVLAKHPFVDEERIGLIGSSQGAWVVPYTASKSKKIAFTICVSGAASSVGRSDYYDEIVETEESIEVATEKLSTFEGYEGFDPYPFLTKVSAPALWIYGGMDKSNPTFWDIRILESIKEKYHKDFTIQLYKNFNHEMIDVSTQQFGVEMIPNLQQWIQAQIDDTKK